MTMVNGVNFTRTGDPQADLKTYMNARGIDEATAKAELEAQFGVPQMIQANDVDEDSALEIDTTDSESATTTEAITSETTDTSDTTDTTDQQATDRAGLEKEIGSWNAKLKQATDAGDQWGITQAQSQLKTLQERAKSWDTGA